MSAETLREAAAYLRQSDRTSRTDYDEALADWLDSTANDVQHVHDPIYSLTSTTVSRAVKVADAVLGGGER